MTKDINIHLTKGFRKASHLKYELESINLHLQEDVMNLTINDNKGVQNYKISSSRAKEITEMSPVKT